MAREADATTHARPMRRQPTPLGTLALAVTLTALSCGPMLPPTAALPALATTGPSLVPGALSLPGWFAFTVQGGDLWVMRGDGSDRHEITTSGDGVDISPTWSPDASRIAFRHSSGAGSGPQDTDTIRIVEADGSGVRNLVEGSFPAWSPDGAWIALRGIEGVDLAVIKPDGSGLTALGVRNAECPVWSPDGTRILYCRNEEASGVVSDDWDVWVMDRDGSHQRQLTNDPGRDYPTAWSPDGSRIVFYSDRDGAGASFLMRADGSSVTRLNDATDLSSVGAWLPDGRFVISSAGNDIPEWFVLDGDRARRPIPQLKGAFDPIAWTEGR